jgi:proline iminopeptidase
MFWRRGRKMLAFPVAVLVAGAVLAAPAYRESGAAARQPAGAVAPVLRTFATPCGTLAYEESGAGEPIILLAGGPGMNPAYMRPVAKVLVEAGRRAVLLHQRGTGASASAIRCRARMTVSGSVADIEDLRVHLGVDKIRLAGHSWGGMLAMAYAQRYPEHVGALLLLDTGPMQAASFPIEDAVVRSRLTAAEQAALRQAQDGAPVEKIERRAFFWQAGNARLLEQSIPAGEPLWYQAAGDLIGRGLKNFDVAGGMRALHAPVILIFGRQDPGFFSAEQIRGVCPQARIMVIEEAGHYPWLEQPAQTARAIQSAVAAMP